MVKAQRTSVLLECSIMYRASISYPFLPRLREHPKRESRKAKSWGLGNGGAEWCPLDTTGLLHRLMDYGTSWGCLHRIHTGSSQTAFQHGRRRGS